MTLKADWETIERLFHEAADLPAAQLEALLSSADDGVRAEV